MPQSTQAMETEQAAELEAVETELAAQLVSVGRPPCFYTAALNLLFSFFYEWEHRTGTMCPFLSLHPL